MLPAAPALTVFAKGDSYLQAMRNSRGQRHSWCELSKGKGAPGHHTRWFLWETRRESSRMPTPPLLTPAFPGKSRWSTAPCRPVSLFSARGSSGSVRGCEVPVHGEVTDSSISCKLLSFDFAFSCCLPGAHMALCLGGEQKEKETCAEQLCHPVAIKQ